MGRQGAKMYKYGTDYILHEACSLPHIEVRRYTCTRHSVVTTTYKTDFVTYRGLSRHGGGDNNNIPATHLYNALKCYPTFLRSWTYRTSGVKLLIKHRFSYGDYTAKVE